jgi:hypothetical protein
MKSIPVLLATSLLIGSAYAQDPFEKAKQALAARDTGTAVTQFKEAIKVGRKPSESNYYLGAIAFARHHADEAAGFLQAAIDRDNEKGQRRGAHPVPPGGEAGTEGHNRK